MGITTRTQDTPTEITFRGFTYTRTQEFRRAGGWDQTDLEECAKMEARYARRDGTAAVAKKYTDRHGAEIWAVYERGF